MSASTIATIIVCAILLFFAIWGYLRGFFRIILTTMAFVLTIVVAGVLAPHCSSLIQKSFIGKDIEKNISAFIDKNIGTVLDDKTKELQEEVINKLPIPQFIQKEFIKDNTKEGYAEREVRTFSDYLETRLSSLAINMVTYLILLVAIYIAIRIVMGIFKVISKVPVIGGINRFFGLIVGLAEGLLIIWLACLVIMIFANTKFGMQAMEVIQQSPVLKFLYDNNGIVLGANLLFKSFL